VAYLVDTNVLLRLAAVADPRHVKARAAVEALEDHALYVADQNFVEFWNVATRPTGQNGFGLKTEEAERLLSRLERAFPRLPEPTDLYSRWRELIVRFEASGVQVHDAQLVAVMLANEIGHILTFNARDFRRYGQAGIRAVDPGDV